MLSSTLCYKEKEKYFLLFFSVYLFLGLVGTFYNNIVDFRFDLFYDTDPSIKYNLIFMNTLTDLDRHPFVFVMTPILRLLSFITQEPKLAFLLFQAAIATLNNFLLFKILRKININFSTSVLFTLIYAFSFSTLLFVSFPEIYLYSPLIGLILVYYILGVKKEQLSVFNTIKDMLPVLVISFLCILGFGINLINIVLYIPLLIYFFSLSSHKIRKDAILTFIFSGLIFYSFLTLCGEIFFPFLSALITTSSILNYRALDWVMVDFSTQRFIQVLRESLIAPFYALETYFNLNKSGWWFSKEQSIFLLFPFFILAFFPFFKKVQSVPKIIYYFGAIIMLHLILNYFYNSTWFLYSQNYLFFLVIILSYFYSKITHPIKNIILMMFLSFEIIFNIMMLGLFYFALNTNLIDVLVDALGKVLLIDVIIVCFYFIIKLLKGIMIQTQFKFYNKENKT